MTLSVIVVSYNVKGYLSLCLDSVLVAVDRLGPGAAEVFVFDNASDDGSADWVACHYPAVQLIRSEVNLGFSAGNNAAIRRSKGKWVLLLNPDTVVPEDAFVEVLAHAEAHAEVGAIGVPMYDGSGTWLPESKRGLPTPWASFCRLSGLWRLAPTSQVLNRYYWGHTGEEETAAVEVLSGAFMWMRRDALDQAGLLDEDFFMYGEDIDLSIRIQNAGWVNHYFSGSSIVHFKGESTKKGSVAYVRVFHDAMRIFSAKHFAGGQAFAMRLMIEFGIRARAVTAFLQGRVRRHALPLLDISLCAMLAFCVIRAHAWSSGIDHPWMPTLALMGLAVAVSAASGSWFGVWDRPFVRVRSLMAGVSAGLLLVLTYALLPEFLRVSRMATGILALVLVLSPAGLRAGLVKLMPKRFSWRRARSSIGFIASKRRRTAMENWIESSYGSSLYINDLSISKESGFEALVRENELVLCDASVGGKRVLETIRAGHQHGVDVRIVPTGLWLALGGARKKSGPADRLVWGEDGLCRPERKRAKRRLDVAWSMWILFIGPGRGVHSNGFSRAHALQVLRSDKTWIGFHGKWEESERLPDLAPGIFGAGSGLHRVSPEEAKRLDLRYAFDYSWVRDFELLMTLRMD